MRNRHILKIEAQYAKAVLDGRKTFEIRKNDRGFQLGDLIFFCVPDDGILDTQMAHHVYSICYITDYAQQDGYVVMSIYDIDKTE